MKFEVSDRVVYVRPTWDPKVNDGLRRGIVVEKSIRPGSANVQTIVAYEIYGIRWDDNPNQIERGYSEKSHGLYAEPKEGDTFTAPANA